jgi:fatty acid desaturase
MPDTPVIPWRANLMIAVLALAMDAGCLWTASHAQAWPLILVAALVFSFSNHTLFAIVHEAVHGILMPSRYWNECLGSLLAATFPQAFCLQRAFHLSHHRNNRTDSEFFDAIRTDDVAWIKRVQWYGILLGEYWLRIPVACLLWLLFPGFLLWPHLRDTKRAAVRSWGGYGVLESLSRVPPLRSRLEVIWAIAIQCAAWHWLDLTPLGWALCYGAFALNWGSLQYAAHAFSERSVRDGAFDLRAARWLRAFLLNYHLHLAHHRNPHIPWHDLPKHIDDSRERPTFLGQYASMWRGPRPAWGESPQPEAPQAHDPDHIMSAAASA